MYSEERPLQVTFIVNASSSVFVKVSVFFNCN